MTELVRPNAARTLLTIGVEDYFHVGAFHSLITRGQWHRFETRLERNTLRALDLLDEFGIQATFFALGWVADEAPDIIKEIVHRGHEIASKGYYHRAIHGLTPDEFREDLLRSRDALEEASGRRVLGYRMPHGYCRMQDLWALDVLLDEGFAYDSSIRPLFRSIAHEPWRRFAHVHRRGDRELWEFPISTCDIFGIMFPIAGGNYWRQFPHWMMRRWVAQWHRNVDAPFVMYFHVWELDPQQPLISAASGLQRMRHYRNLDRMADLLRDYLGRYDYAPIARYLGLDQPELTAPAAAAPLRAPTRPYELQQNPKPAVVTSLPPGAVQSARRAPVTVVVPCYNEELVLPYLANTLEAVKQELGLAYDLHFLFVDDGSQDGTWKQLKKIFGGREDCTIVRHAENSGVAAAIQTGLASARTEVVCSIDCDCTYDPMQLQDMLPKLTEGVDCVTASPYHPLGNVVNVPTWRLTLSKSLSRLYRLVLHHKLATYTSCFRVYRRSSMADVRVRESGFLGVAEMLGQLDLRGAHIVEHPAVLEVRLLGRSKMKTLRTIGGHLKLLARLTWQRLTGRRPAPRAAPVTTETHRPTPVNQ